MNTSILHIFTSLLPFLFAGIALVFLGYGVYMESGRNIRVSMILLIINGVITTFTSAMGGASLRMAKSIPGVEESVVSRHAWTGMAAFLISVIIAFFAVSLIRSKIYKKNKLKIIFVLVFTFLLLIAGTSFFAFKIR